MHRWVNGSTIFAYLLNWAQVWKLKTMENPVIHLPSVWKWAWLSDSLTKKSIGKEKKNSNITVEKPSKYNLNKWSGYCHRVSIPDRMRQKAYITSTVFFPKTHSSSLINITEKARLGDILQDTWPAFLKTIKVIKKKKKKRKRNTETLSQTTEDLGDMPTQCNVMSWIGFWSREFRV